MGVADLLFWIVDPCQSMLPMHSVFQMRLWLAVSASHLPCGALAGGLAAQPASVVYASAEGSGALLGIDTNSLRVVRHFDVGNRPHNLDRTADGLLAVATQGANAVTIVDTKSESVDRIDLGVPPHDVAARAGGATAFVLSERGLLAEINPASRRVLRRIELEGRPHDVIAWRGTALITDISAGRIFVVEGDGVHTIPISVVGHDLAVRPGTQELWVTPWKSNRAVVVDLGGQKQIAEFRVGRAPSHKHLAFSEDGGEAWIAEPESGNVFVVDAKTREVVDRVALGGHPHHVRIAAGRAYVADGPNDLVILDAVNRRVLGRLAVGAGIHDVAVAVQ